MQSLLPGLVGCGPLHTQPHKSISSTPKDQWVLPAGFKKLGSGGVWSNCSPQMTPHPWTDPEISSGPFGWDVALGTSPGGRACRFPVKP